MLAQTFCHIPGVGERTEQRLWAEGITSWESALAQPPHRVRSDWAVALDESRDRLAGRDVAYFAERVPARQQWRLYRDFQDCCAFLDIETTGLVWGSPITTIVLYDGRNLRTYVQGRNLDDFLRDVHEYRLLVTYNGKTFDLPFIERYFGVRLPHAHIDLRYPLRSLGLKGGLKGCERQLGIDRPGLDNVDGFVAVLLWEEYRRTGDEKALETLLAYNIQDTVNLQTLMCHAFRALVARTPFAGSQELPPCPAPALPYQPDAATLARVASRLEAVGGVPWQRW